MYLSGSKWNMKKKRRRRSNPWRILLLIGLIVAAFYINQVVVPVTPPLFIPTPTPTRSPESYVTDAENLFEEGKLFKSIEAYKEAILVDPDNPANYVSLSRVQILAGHYEDAQEYAELSLLHNPDNPRAHAMRAWALDFQGDYLDAEISVKRALELDPNNAIAHAIYAEILIDRGSIGDVENAIQESRIAMELAPDLLEVRRARGYVLYTTQNYDEAIIEFKAAIAINNKIPNLHALLGYSHRAMSDYDLAVEAFNQSNALNPQDPIPDYEISRIYFIVGEFNRAAQYAGQAVKDFPTDSKLYGNLGVMYAKTGDYDLAITNLAIAIHGGTTEDGIIVEGLPLDYNTRIIEFYSTYGLSLARSNRCTEALPIFQTMLSLVPNDEIAVYNAEEGIRICQDLLDSIEADSGNNSEP
jgi:tetratricopeptide (TPR) repeat protein